MLEKYLAEKDGQIETVLQEPQLGTGHAVMQAQSFIDKHLDDDIIILNGDGPLIDAETINKAFEVRFRFARLFLQDIFQAIRAYIR